MEQRRYPVGLQTFSRIIKENYIYVDKTDLVWKLAHYSTFVFLSRPRRFGKSLLTSTLASYFEGDRDLFQGLKIMELEQEWASYPVIKLDISIAKSQEDAAALQARLMLILKDYTDKYGKDEDEVTPGGLLNGLIRRAYAKTGKQVVVIIDEYDAPLLEVMHEERNLSAMRKVMQEFYQPLKANEGIMKFCFITGITKFSQLSIFSTINNITNVTLNPRFSAICGITDEEVRTVFAEDIAEMSKVYECSPEQMYQKIKDRYDGYHFASVSDDIYNPFSLLNCFRDEELQDFWFATGTPTFLIEQMKHFNTDIMSLEKLEVPASAFDQPTENMEDALPLLYQSGYLTIKGYDRATGAYTLSIPNREVRIGYVRGLLPSYTGLKTSDVQMSFAARFWKALIAEDIELAMREMQAYMACIPYVEGFKKKLSEVATAEGFYEYTMYLIFSMLNVYVRTQVKCAGGRVDMVVWMPGKTYVFEMKVSGTAREALEQIDSKSYALPFKAEGREVVKIGVKFNKDTRTPEEWVVEE